MAKTISEDLRSWVIAAVDTGKSRRGWFKAEPDLDPERLVCIDETGGSTKMARLRSRAKRSMRSLADPAQPLENHHITGALRSTGMTAPWFWTTP